MLVGTHLELREDKGTLEKLAKHHQTPIKHRQGLQLQREISATRYIECSAREQKNVDKVFEEALCVSLGTHEKAICPICNKMLRVCPDVIFCEGECNAWLHKKCAGFNWLSKPSFKTVTSDIDKVFHCPRCIKSMSSPNCSNEATIVHISVLGKCRVLTCNIIFLCTIMQIENLR